MRYPGYRRYYIGMVASAFSWQMMVRFSLTWMMYDLTEDPMDLGYVGAAVAVPSVCFNLLGGVFADKLDPRRLIGVVELLSAAQMGVLGLLSLMDWAEPWHVILAAALFGGTQAFDSPARNSMYARLIEHKDLRHAVALNSFLWTGARTISPAIAGFIVGKAGVAPTIFMATAGFLSIAMLIQTVNLSHVERTRGKVFQEMWMGLTYIREHGIFLSLISLAYLVGIFGMSYVFLMPVFAKEILGVGSEGMGWLLAVSGIGSVVGIFATINLGHFQYRGWTIIGGVVIFGAFLISFALSPWYWLSLLLVFLVGASGSVFLISNMTILQMLVPNEFRGRVMGIYTVTHTLAPVGAIQSGFIAAQLSPQFAVALGGVLVIIFAIFMGFGSQHIRSLSAARLAVN